MTRLEELKAAYGAACDDAETAWAAADTAAVAYEAARDAYYDELKKQEENSND
jgi:hypothetical protein